MEILLSHKWEWWKKESSAQKSYSCQYENEVIEYRKLVKKYDCKKWLAKTSLICIFYL